MANLAWLRHPRKATFISRVAGDLAGHRGRRHRCVVEDDVHAPEGGPDHQHRRAPDPDREPTTEIRARRAPSATTATTRRKQAPSPPPAAAGWPRHSRQAHHCEAAIVLDVDDTTLTTWNYEIASNWAYNPDDQRQLRDRPDVPRHSGHGRDGQQGSRGRLRDLLHHRPAEQPGRLPRSATSATTAWASTPATRSTRPTCSPSRTSQTIPSYLKTACAGDPGGKCTTIHYKAATRAYIESMGYDIVANFGDQYSDLTGGYADRAFKMPNPNYYLP